LEAKADAAGTYKLSGTKSFVCDAPTADLIIVAARTKEDLLLAALPAGAAGVRILPTPGIDATRKLAEVQFDGAATTEVLAVGGAAEKALARSTDVAMLAACAEMLGSMQWILEHAVEYAKTRQQFGKTIGTFQAVQHMCADMLLWTESSRSAIYYAAWALDAQPETAARDVAIAKAYASDAVREVANRGVQIHGGIGFTWEHDLQLYYKRAKALEIAFGDAAHHRERLAAMAFEA
jgi:alkylation response protein AidB-like acyl-CoA dehydrogenase